MLVVFSICPRPSQGSWWNWAHKWYLDESRKGMDVIIGNVGDLDARGLEELTVPSMPTVFTKGRSVVDVDDDDFVNKTPLAKRPRKKARPFSIRIHKLSRQTCSTLTTTLMRRVLCITRHLIPSIKVIEDDNHVHCREGSIAWISQHESYPYHTNLTVSFSTLL